MYSLHALAAADLGPASRLAEALLSGDDEVARGPLPDCLEEMGIDSMNVSLLADVIGTTVYVQTVTYGYVGTLVRADFAGVVLGEQVARLYDTGQFSLFMAKGEITEAEPYPPGCTVRILSGCIVEVSNWPFPVPTTVV